MSNTGIAVARHRGGFEWRPSEREDGRPVAGTVSPAEGVAELVRDGDGPMEG